MITQSTAYLSFSLGNVKSSSLATFVQTLVYLFLVFFGIKYFSLYGLVLSPIISMLVITTWYHPLSVARVIKLSSDDIKDVLYQGFLAVVLIIPQTLIFSHIQPKSWLLFSFCIIIYCLLYIASLFIFSKEFKYQIQSLFNKK